MRINKLIILFLLLYPITGFSFLDSSKFEFEMIDSLKANKSELYSYARQWVANEFVSANSVIQMEDKDVGKIIGKGVYSFKDEDQYSTTQFNIKFTLEITVKDNKYRIRLYDFINDGYLDLKGSDLKGGRIKGAGLYLDDPEFKKLSYSKEQVIPRTKEKALLMLSSLKEFIQKQKKDDF